jgi:FtsP/CotA-like multicopper oxidase with cupredoxin domain
MTLSRRRFLRLTGSAVAVGTAAGCGLRVPDGQTAALVAGGAPPPTRFAVPLTVPAVKAPLSTRDGTDLYELVARQTDMEILPGLRTTIFGYDGTFPGPTIEARRDRPVAIRHRNELAVPTVAHLHGGHTPAESDGFPTDLVLPARGAPMAHPMPGADLVTGVREHHYPGDQRAATLWYHDHRMDFTGPQVYKGLAGFHLLRDSQEDALPLPRGARELPLMICDRSFDPGGGLRYPSLDRTLQEIPGVEPAFTEGVLGEVILVNGRPWPVLEVDAARYRLRLLNASNARRYELALEPGGDLVQIGSDGGLLAAPVRHTSIAIAPAERFDVVVDFSAYPVGTEVILRNRLGSGALDAVMKFVVTRRAADDSRIPDRLADIEPIDRAAARTHREFRFARGSLGPAGARRQGWLINGQPFDPVRMDARPKLGDLEVWTLRSDLHHPVHVHLDPFQVLSRDGRPPAATDSGWKDTVDLRPFEGVDVGIRFSGYAGRYVLHCHNLEHEDMAMMAAFEVSA